MAIFGKNNKYVTLLTLTCISALQVSSVSIEEEEELFFEEIEEIENEILAEEKDTEWGVRNHIRNYEPTYEPTYKPTYEPTYEQQVIENVAISHSQSVNDEADDGWSDMQIILIIGAVSLAVTGLIGLCLYQHEQKNEKISEHNRKLLAISPKRFLTHSPCVVVV